MDQFRVFGSPVSVLAKQLQDGDSLPKWKSQCWVSVYVGHSLAHSGHVPVVYNPQTTHISPQFHVVFDDQFTTATANPSNCSPKFFENLYNTASWLHKDSFSAASDLHHFESYWLAPPISTTNYNAIKPGPFFNPSRSSYKKHPAGAPVRHQQGNPTIHPAGNPARHQQGDPARHLQGDPALHPASDPARDLGGDNDPARYSASDGIEQPNRDHSPLSAENLCAHLTPAFVHSPAGQPPSPPSKNPNPNTSSRKRPRPTDRDQLSHIPCGSDYTTYKLQHGIDAKVYTVIATQDNHHIFSSPDAPMLDTVPTVFLSSSIVHSSHHI
jgi:hypothetical protein